MHDGWSKYILRRGIEGRVPDPICWRRDKIGFAAPQASWTKKHNEKMRSTIRSSRMLRELVDLKALENSGFAIDGASLWRLYSAAMWEESLSISSLS
jgi:asparagine synthase (glutamine-hydrolysing)